MFSPLLLAQLRLVESSALKDGMASCVIQPQWGRHLSAIVSGLLCGQSEALWVIAMEIPAHGTTNGTERERLCASQPVPVVGAGVLGQWRNKTSNKEPCICAYLF